MRSILSLIGCLFSWCLIAMAVFGMDPVKAGDKPNPYAGEYSFGDGKGWNCDLILSTDGKFRHSRRGCLGVYDKQQGEYEVKNGTIILKPDTPTPRFGARSLSKVYHPVPWGGRMYLIPPDEMTGFCLHVNYKREPRKAFFGVHYLRRGDWEKPVTGRPDLPKEFVKHLDPLPVSGKIIELTGKDEAWVDFGSDAGMEIGQNLYVEGSEKTGVIKVRIVAVEKTKSRVKLDKPTDRMEKGDSVCSRPPISFVP